jgi:hypothetical protein
MSGGSRAVWMWTPAGELPAWAANSGLQALKPGGRRPGPEDAVLNGRAGVVRRFSDDAVQARLVREGLAAEIGGAEDGNDRRRFAVTVFDLEAVELRRRWPDGGGALYPGRGGGEPAIDGKLKRALERAAVRAVYILGLDFGQVEAAVDPAGRVIVRSVRPQARPATEAGAAALAEAAARAAAAWGAEPGRPSAAMLGADPEFVLLAPDGRIVPASRYFPRRGPAGCDSVVVRGVRRWPLAELRPAPAAEPAALAAGLRRLLAAAARSAGAAGEPLAWRAGALPVRGLPLGGHVHVSGVPLTGERLRALDNAVALPLRLLEPPEAAHRRPRYGALGDVRRQSHGGFEYRTPPSWLVSPRLALGALALAKAAAEEPSRLRPFPLDSDRLRDAFYASGKDPALEEAVWRVYGALSRTEGYRRYAELIDPLFEAIRAGRTWNERADLRERWKVPLRPT